MRQYLVGSWNNADSYDYSGEQLMGNRLGASREVPHFLADGRANVQKYGDNVAPEKKPTNVPLKQRILPQASRLDKLTNDLIELEQEYKQGKMSTDEYSMYRSVAITRRDRAWILYCKAIGISPTDTDQNNSDSAQVKGETAFNIDDVEASSLSHRTAQSTRDDNGFVASIPDGNIFKGVVEKACKGWKLCVKFKTQASNYIQTLKEV